MRKSVVGLLLLVIPSLCYAEITFEGDSKVAQYTIARIRPKSDDYKSFIIKVFDSNNKRVKTERGENGWILFTGSPGKYRVEAVAGKTDKDGNLHLDEAEFTVTIEGKEPDPDPDPKPPLPDDALTKRLRDAYSKDQTTGKSKKILTLAEVYRVVSTIDLKDVATAGDLFKNLKNAVKLAGLAEDDLRLVRMEIQTELKKVLPDDISAKLSVEERGLASALFAKLGTSLLKVATQEKLR